jgi:hypothetical protein
MPAHTGRLFVMVAAWSTGKPEQPFEPWACANCPTGRMVWFACDLRPDHVEIEHKFACDACGEIEHVTLPFVEPTA